MKHPDWPAFLAAIIAEPHDDTPRLVAADFLEEHGEADRAAFIRVQVELARLEASNLADSPDAVALRARERAFLGPKYEKRLFWALDACPELVHIPLDRPGSPLARVHVEGAERLTWRRGFVAMVRCPAAEWLRHGVAVRKRQPIECVTLTGCAAPDRGAWYAGLPALSKLATVVLVDGPAGHAEWLQQWLPDTQVLSPRS
jgi:uncharacterized protein (TIGR02996 family)